MRVLTLSFSRTVALAIDVQSDFVLFLKRSDQKAETPFCIFISFADDLKEN